MTKKFNQEIANLKQAQFWIKHDLDRLNKLLKLKSQEVVNCIRYIEKLKLQERYDEIKQHNRTRLHLLKEQEAFIHLQCTLHTELHTIGHEIVTLRITLND